VSLIAVAAGKGSPGVTTTALALAAVWPRPALFAECDPAGGDVVFGLRTEDGSALAGDRGIVSLATAQRVPGAVSDVLAHAQVVDGGLPVLVGVASPTHANALAGSWCGIAASLASCGSDVFADCGRLAGGTLIDDVLNAADRILVVCRATSAGVAHARSALELLCTRQHAVPISVVVIGAPGSPGQVASALRGFGELDVIGPVAVDPDGAGALAGRWTRRLDRSPLVVSVRLLARAVDARLSADRALTPMSQQVDEMSEVG